MHFYSRIPSRNIPPVRSGSLGVRAYEPPCFGSSPIANPTSRTVTIPDTVVAEVVDDETIILHLDSGIYFRLDPVGTRFLVHFRETGDLDETRALMLADYDVDEATLRVDLDRLVDQLLDKGLMVAAPSGVG